jgi:hypothetical protein
MKAKLAPLFVSFLLLAGCRPAARQDEGTVEVVFSVLGEGTRVNGTEEERAVDNWTLLLYKDGRLAEAGTSDSGSAIRKKLAAGDYAAFAVVNPPASFRAADHPEPDDVAGAESDLRDNAPGRLVMAGGRTVTVPVPDGGTQRIGVDRLVCKADIRKISVQFDNPALADRTFLLKAVYLTNCYGKSRYGSDWGAEDILSDGARWYHRMGLPSDGGLEGLLAERGIDERLTADTPHVREHTFYFYPNPLSETQDTRSGTWSRRHTRLVIEAQIGGRTYYYPVTLPASRRNRTYIIEEAVIRKLGSRDPEKDEPGAIDVTFSTAADDWSPAFTVTETS